MKKQTFRTLLLVVGVVILLCIVGLGSAVWLFMNTFDVGKTDAASATQEFDEIRARFAGSSPVLVIHGDAASVARRPPSQDAKTHLTTMNVVAWDPEDDTFTRIDLPFWLLRLKSGPIKVMADEARMSDTELGLTVEDLERYGPTLVLDHQTRRGHRVLVWTE